MRRILSEIVNSHLLVNSSAVLEIEKLINSHKPDSHTLPKLQVLSGSSYFDLNESCDNVPQDSVLVIPIVGVMFKYNSWWDYGMDYYAEAIRQADENPNITGTVLLLNTPGGTTQSLLRMEEVLRQRTKPCVAVVDGMCCSCGMYIASFCDKIVATNRMCEIGSIGVCVTIQDSSEMLKGYGIKLIEVYPPESSFKNKGVRDAIAGDNSTLIRDALTPFAQHFQNVIRTNRPKVDEEIEGILEGRVFYAYDAKTNGLIDDITTMSSVTTLVEQLAEDRQQISKLFT